jgi:hypothetical protein
VELDSSKLMQAFSIRFINGSFACNLSKLRSINPNSGPSIQTQVHQKTNHVHQLETCALKPKLVVFSYWRRTSYMCEVYEDVTSGSILRSTLQSSTNATLQEMLRSGGTTSSTERVLPPDLGAAMRLAIKTRVRVDSTSHHAAPIHGSGLLDAQRQEPMLVKLFSGVMSWSLLLAQRFHMRENIMCTSSLRTARPLHEKFSI